MYILQRSEYPLYHRYIVTLYVFKSTYSIEVSSIAHVQYICITMYIMYFANCVIILLLAPLQGFEEDIVVLREHCIANS